MHLGCGARYYETDADVPVRSEEREWATVVEIRDEPAYVILDGPEERSRLQSQFSWCR